MEGISNQAGQEKNPYLTAGDKTYIIGTQDGNFPDLGGHTPGEMGGVWNHLIKLLDGFWVKMTDNKKIRSTLSKKVKKNFFQKKPKNELYFREK